MKHRHTFICLGSAFALTAVILGAFGAHALKVILLERGTLETWKTAVDYHMWHALGLLLLANLPLNDKIARFCLNSFCLGIFLFSGSLYALALGAPNWLGPITPLGGLCFIVGWGLLAWKSCKPPVNATN